MRPDRCECCGRWGQVEEHHKVFKGMGRGRGFDFPLNFTYLCANCHRGNDGPHRNSYARRRHFEELKRDLHQTLTASHYWPEDIALTLTLPMKQARRICKLIQPEEQGYPSERIIYRLLGDRYDWDEPLCESV